jgi:Zn-dependent M28 family amino/carboxypeptidase
VPAGSNDGIEVPAGTTLNVIAEPPAFDGAQSHLVVGAHLDTVPDSPGANDNASGVAIMLELARLARADPPPLPVVFVAFGAEERRRQGRGASVYALGSRAYLRALPGREQESVRGALVLDTVGAGSRIDVLGSNGAMARAVLATAGRLGVPARRSTTRFYSDDVAFLDAGIDVAWLWAGEHPTLHTPRDTVGVIDPAELARVGSVAWATLRSVGP